MNAMPKPDPGFRTYALLLTQFAITLGAVYFIVHGMK